MLFACLLTDDGSFLWPRIEIPVQSPGHVDPCDCRPCAPDTPSSELAPGRSAHWKRDHLGIGMVTGPFVSPSTGNPSLVRMSLPQGWQLLPPCESLLRASFLLPSWTAPLPCTWEFCMAHSRVPHYRGRWTPKVHMPRNNKSLLHSFQFGGEQRGGWVRD